MQPPWWLSLNLWVQMLELALGLCERAQLAKPPVMQSCSCQPSSLQDEDGAGAARTGQGLFHSQSCWIAVRSAGLFKSSKVFIHTHVSTDTDVMLCVWSQRGGMLAELRQGETRGTLRVHPGTIQN